MQTPWLAVLSVSLVSSAGVAEPPLAPTPPPALHDSIATPVVGGTVAKPGAWPDVAAILTEDGSLCSGALVAPDVVLTAGHCIGGHPVEVIFDAIDLAASRGTRVGVSWSKAYPSWQSRYDVGVVVLEHPVTTSPRAFAMGCSVSGGDVAGARNRLTKGAPLTVVGFGLTTRTATDNNTRLHQATIDVVDGDCSHDASCNASVAPQGEFTAGGHGVDACFGDSGGPVYIGTGSGQALIGVVSRGLASWGDPCGEGGVFVRADQVVPWIEQVTARTLERVDCDMPADDGGVAVDDISDGAEGCDAAGAPVAGNLALLVLMLALPRLRRRQP